MKKHKKRFYVDTETGGLDCLPYYDVNIADEVTKECKRIIKELSNKRNDDKGDR